MSKVVAFMHLTLDGVMQAPGRPDEDPHGGFEHGGWAAMRSDSAIGSVVAEAIDGSGCLLLGRRTYEDFYLFWPKQTDNPFSAVLDDSPKFVASTTLHEPLAWTNSVLLNGDAATAVAELKRQPGKDLVVLGSGVLTRSMMRHNLIDQFLLLIHPLVIGSGRRLFDGSITAELRLLDAKPTPSGVVIARYVDPRRVPGEPRARLKLQPVVILPVWGARRCKPLDGYERRRLCRAVRSCPAARAARAVHDPRRPAFCAASVGSGRHLLRASARRALAPSARPLAE